MTQVEKIAHAKNELNKMCDEYIAASGTQKIVLKAMIAAMTNAISKMEREL